MSFFCPKPGKLTVNFAASPAPSRLRTRPRPYFGWRTCVPGVKPASAFGVEAALREEEALRVFDMLPDDALPDEALPDGFEVLPDALARLMCGSVSGLGALWPSCWPRLRKNSAMESTLS